MRSMPYAPEAGDLIWTDFDPRLRREQSGRRPALVVLARRFLPSERVRAFVRSPPVSARSALASCCCRGCPFPGDPNQPRAQHRHAGPSDQLCGSRAPLEGRQAVDRRSCGRVAHAAILTPHRDLIVRITRGEPRRVGRSVDLALCTVGLRHFFAWLDKSKNCHILRLPARSHRTAFCFPARRRKFALRSPGSGSQASDLVGLIGSAAHRRAFLN
jgi:hypothetical protein